MGYAILPARLTCIALLVLATMHACPAAVLTYYGSDDPRGTFTNSLSAFDDFTATLSSFGVDDIESYNFFQADPVLTFGATGIAAQSDINVVGIFAGLEISGQKFLNEAGPAVSTGPAVNDAFVFNVPITAFGSFFSQAGNEATPNQISLVLENTLLATSKTVVLPDIGTNRSFNSVFFFGVTDTDPFNKITLVESFDFDGIVLDNVTAGYVVPEANSLVLASALVAVFVAMARKRQTLQPE